MKSLRKAKVSVIVAVYNAERYLPACLDSLCAQEFSNMEIICVDDGSTDRSYAILEEYAGRDGRFQIFTKENEGLGGAPARNYGLSKAAGEYVSILDSDDFFEPNMLRKAVCKAEETGADIVLYGGYEYDDRSGTDRQAESILKASALPDKDVFSCEDCPGTIFQISQGMAWNKLYRRSFLEGTGILFQRIRYTDDAYFTFSHMVKAGRIAAINEPLIHYRVNSGVNQTSGIASYPESSYLPYLALKKSLKDWGLHGMLERSFINCAAVFIRYCYDMIGKYDSFAWLHGKLREEVLQELGIAEASEGEFYDWRTYAWVRQVMGNSAGEILFSAARAFGGGDSTTGILRFPFPYENIQKNSSVAIIGERILGRYYYAQAVLSGHCNIVAWVGRENPQGLAYIKPLGALRDVIADCYLLAYSEEEKIQEVLRFLGTLGIPREKIIVGMGALAGGMLRQGYGKRAVDAR